MHSKGIQNFNNSKIKNKNDEILLLHNNIRVDDKSDNNNITEETSSENKKVSNNKKIFKIKRLKMKPKK